MKPFHKESVLVEDQPFNVDDKLMLMIFLRAQIWTVAAEVSLSKAPK